jgi:TatD DNase family protein
MPAGTHSARYGDGMIDSHCHLDACDDPEGAIDPSLRAIVTIGTTVDSDRASVARASAHGNVWAVVGIHPNNASDADDPRTRRVVEDLAGEDSVVGIGETGFDTYWQDESPTSQRRAFDWQAGLAARLDKALVLHVRDAQGRDDASRAAVEALRAAGHRRGILHCFNAHDELLETGLELGWMVSFAGNLTYQSAQALRDAALKVPLDRLLVETDSPYLAPVPMRGKRNRPAYVRHTAEVLATVRGMTVEALEPILDANAARVYGLPLACDTFAYLRSGGVVGRGRRGTPNHHAAQGSEPGGERGQDRHDQHQQGRSQEQRREAVADDRAGADQRQRGQPHGREDHQAHDASPEGRLGASVTTRPAA